MRIVCATITNWFVILDDVTGQAYVFIALMPNGSAVRQLFFWLSCVWLFPILFLLYWLEVIELWLCVDQGLLKLGIGLHSESGPRYSPSTLCRDWLCSVGWCIIRSNIHAAAGMSVLVQRLEPIPSSYRVMQSYEAGKLKRTDSWANICYNYTEAAETKMPQTMYIQYIARYICKQLPL